MFPVIPPSAPLLGAPALDQAIVTLIPAGSAAGLFPVIAPAAANLTGSAGARAGSGSALGPPGATGRPAEPSPAPDAGSPTAEHALSAAADASSRSTGMLLTAGLVAAGLAILLVTTRLSARMRKRM